MSIKNLFIPPNISIRKAIEILNDQHKRIVLITEENGKLLGVLTDSDLRRIILKSGSLERPVAEVMIKTPLTVNANLSDSTILNLMKQKQIHQIPVLDDNGIVIDLKLIDDIFYTAIDAEAFIFAGGLGSRLYPLTREIPKPLVKVGGKEILFTIIDGLLESGFQRITLGLHYKANIIREAVGKVTRYNDVIRFVEEKKSLGTAGALAFLEKNDKKSPILVMNGDILTKVNYFSLINYHKQEKNIITIALRTESIRIPYGVVELKGDQVTSIKEKPEFKFFINAGIYVLDPCILDFLDKEECIDMPDLISRGMDKGIRIGSFPLHEYWIDIGRHEELEKADQEYKKFFK